MVMVVITAMETILQGVVTTVAHNPHHITNVTMHIVKLHILDESRLSATMHQKSAQTQQSMDCNRLYIDYMRC